MARAVYGASLGACTLSAYVSAANQVTVIARNTSASVAVLAGTLLVEAALA